jgi:hypothetical protein
MDACCVCSENEATVRFENGGAACVACVARVVEADAVGLLVADVADMRVGSEEFLKSKI